MLINVCFLLIISTIGSIGISLSPRTVSRWTSSGISENKMRKSKKEKNCKKT